MIESAEPAASIVFLFDVDNTLLDNDRLKTYLAGTLAEIIGPERAGRFWQIYEQVRADEDVVDFPMTIARMVRADSDPELPLALDSIFSAIPFRRFVYPHVDAVLNHCRTVGTTVILSDGDRVYQRHKIDESGLSALVESRVLIYVHKERELSDVFRQYRADHYVMVDDKPRILAALERGCPGTFTTILVEQGRYGVLDPTLPRPDQVVKTIGALRNFSEADFRR